MVDTYALPIGTVISYEIPTRDNAVIIAQKIDATEWKVLHKSPQWVVEKHQLFPRNRFSDFPTRKRNSNIKSGQILKLGELLYG